MSNDLLTESRENGTHNRSPLTWLVAAAAAVIIAGVGIFAVVNGQGADEQTPPPQAADPTVTELVGPDQAALSGAVHGAQRRPAGRPARGLRRDRRVDRGRAGHPRGHPLVRRGSDRPGDRRGAERGDPEAPAPPCSSRTAGATWSPRTRAASCSSAASARRTPRASRRSTTRRSRPDDPATLCEAWPVSLHGLLLAAGAGTRMGTPKALVRDQDGTSWLLRSVGVLRDGGCVGVTVVLGAEAARGGGAAGRAGRPGRRRRPLGRGHGRVAPRRPRRDGGHRRRGRRWSRWSTCRTCRPRSYAAWSPRVPIRTGSPGRRTTACPAIPSSSAGTTGPRWPSPRPATGAPATTSPPTPPSWSSAGTSRPATIGIVPNETVVDAPTTGLHQPCSLVSPSLEYEHGPGPTDDDSHPAGAGGVPGGSGARALRLRAQ